MNAFIVTTKVTFAPYIQEMGTFTAHTADPRIEYTLRPGDYEVTVGGNRLTTMTEVFPAYRGDIL